MSTEEIQAPATPPVITAARMKLIGKHQNRVWDLFAGEMLVGWTPEDPARRAAAGANFTPSCWGPSGQHVTVSYSPTLTIA